AKTKVTRASARKLLLLSFGLCLSTSASTSARLVLPKHINHPVVISSAARDLLLSQQIPHCVRNDSVIARSLDEAKRNPGLLPGLFRTSKINSVSRAERASHLSLLVQRNLAQRNTPRLRARRCA